MTNLPMLIRREFWEHRNTFVVLPLMTTAFFMLMMLALVTASSSDFFSMSIDMDQRDSETSMVTDDVVSYILYDLDSMSERNRVDRVNGGLHSISAPLAAILWFVVFFYLLSCLYEDRKDRSILFWKSLPVSDAMTVISKLVTALVVVPFVYLACIAVLQLWALVLLTVSALSADLSAWDLLWGPAQIFTNWFKFIGVCLFYGLWALPFYGWLASVSAYASSVPLAWATGLPVAFSIVERIFTSQSRISDWMADHTIPVSFLGGDSMSGAQMQAQLLSLQMLSAVVVGAGLVYLAIWLRGKADEI